MYEFKFEEEESDDENDLFWDYNDNPDMFEIIHAKNPIKILVDDQFLRYWSPRGKTPYYQMRGKRISEQQAFDIICRTDSAFEDLDLDGHLRYINFENNWMLRRYGWVHPNGIIGINSITPKFPTVDEFAHEWVRYLYNFPFLDLIIGITWWDGMSDERTEIFLNYDWSLGSFDDDYKYVEYDDFCENIEVGIWVHDGIIEIIDRERTIEVYKKYEKLYEEEDHRIYFPEYYEEFQPDITTMEYLKKCFLTYGITDAEKYLSEKLQPYEFDMIVKRLKNKNF